MNIWKMFYRCLKDHPGVPIACIWTLMVAVAILTKQDASEIEIERILLVVGLIGALPWIPVFWATWKNANSIKKTKNESPTTQ